MGRSWWPCSFAKLLNCLEAGSALRDACDRCVSCRKINDHVHPMSFSLNLKPNPEVEQVRQMQRDLGVPSL